MKKTFFFALACVCMAFASCDKGFKPVKYQLTPDLVSVKAVSEAGDTTYTVQTVAGEEVIPATSRFSFTTLKDDNLKRFLIAKPVDGGNLRWYYTLKGAPITDDYIKDFKLVINSSRMLFAGTTPEGKKVLFFPEDGETILTEAYTVDAKSATLGYATGEGFVITSLKSDSGEPWTVKEEPAFFVTFSTQTPTDPCVVITSKKNATIYKLNGDKDKTIPIAKWTQALKGAKDKTLVGKVTALQLPKAL